jgi:hypothetical protein
MVALVRRNAHWPTFSWATFTLFVVTALAAFIVVLREPLPVIQNILYDFGTGALTLQDTTYLNPDWRPFQLGVLWWPLTVLAIFSADVLFAEISTIVFQRLRSFQKKPDVAAAQKSFLVLWLLYTLATAYNPLLNSYLDRYLLPAVVPALLLCAYALPRRPTVTVTATTLCLLMYLASLCSVQDYMAWNHARWSAADYLRTDLAVSATEIDGGFEFNGMHTSDAFMVENDTRDFRVRGDKGWWVFDDTYAISFLPRAGYDTLERFPYYSWLGFTERHVLALRRVAVTASDP